MAGRRGLAIRLGVLSFSDQATSRSFVCDVTRGGREARRLLSVECGQKDRENSFHSL
jgi:hypothetical protein